MRKIYTLITFIFLFGIEVVNAQYNVILNFDSLNGQQPLGALVLSANRVYGMTNKGGAHDLGLIFSVDTNGSGYKDLFDFNGSNGANPWGSLIFSNGKLYGMAAEYLFSIDTNGGGYTIIHDFTKDTTFSVNSPYAVGSLTQVGSKLYGMTQAGGAYDSGFVFRVDTNGSGYKVILEFNGSDGSSPYGSLIYSKGILYGMTFQGGANNYGTIFSVDTNGGGYKDLFDFNNSDGADPMGDLTLLGSKLYGTASGGGVNNYGCIFSINTNGSGYKDFYDFNGKNGEYPEGNLTPVGSLLYGMTMGEYIFAVDTIGNYKGLFNFHGGYGELATSSLITSGNVFYGMTQWGGKDSDGVVFRFRDTLPTCFNNYNQTICIVTTDTSINKNVIIWGRNDSPTNGSFNIYDSISSGWILIGNVPDTALSMFVDTASNPSLQSYSYRISTVDSCGESALSPFNSTIFLQVLQEVSGRDSLYWTPYVGFSTSYYLIYRGPALNKLTLIDSVSGSVLQYIDTLPPAGSIYLIKAENPSGGCTPTHKHISPYHSNVSAYASISNGGIPVKVTGIGNIISPKSVVIISPNPNNGRFSIQIKNCNSGSNSVVEVYNMFGEKVYSEALRQAQCNNQIDLSNEPSGIYLYRVKAETGELISEGKFIKE